MCSSIVLQASLSVPAKAQRAKRRASHARCSVARCLTCFHPHRASFYCSFPDDRLSQMLLLLSEVDQWALDGDQPGFQVQARAPHCLCWRRRRRGRLQDWTPLGSGPPLQQTAVSGGRPAGADSHVWVCKPYPASPTGLCWITAQHIHLMGRGQQLDRLGGPGNRSGKRCMQNSTSHSDISISL